MLFLSAWVNVGTLSEWRRNLLRFHNSQLVPQVLHGNPNLETDHGIDDTARIMNWHGIICGFPGHTRRFISL